MPETTVTSQSRFSRNMLGYIIILSTISSDNKTTK